MHLPFKRFSFANMFTRMAVDLIALLEKLG